MEFKDYYGILGVDEKADDKTIKTAYRRLARKYHPDVSGAPDTEQRFKEIAEAYQVLHDEEKRREYDQLRRYQGQSGDRNFQPPPGWHSGASSSDAFSGEFSGEFSDFFENLFGGGFRNATPRRGRDLEVELPLFLEDLLSDSPKTVRLELAGREKTLNVTVPPGTGDGERIRLKGQGAPGPAGGDPGDLYLRVRLAPHPWFDVSGQDLILTVPVAPWEAALGARIQVPTLDGRITLSVPPGSQTGRRLRVRARGLPDKNGRGDLYAVLKVVMPEPSDAPRTQTLWRELQQESDFNPRTDWER